MGVNLGESVALVAIETSAFKSEPSILTYVVTLGALHAGNRRMLVKQREASGRVRACEKPDFSFSAFPQQRERVYTGTHLKNCVKHIRKRLFGENWLAV